MPLLNDEARCTGQQCPSALNCQRFTERATGDAKTPTAAFHMRRGAGDSGCSSYLPVRPVSTFDAQHALGRIINANPAEI